MGRVCDRRLCRVVLVSVSGSVLKMEVELEGKGIETEGKGIEMEDSDGVGIVDRV